MPLYVIVRLRGLVNVNPHVEETLQLLRLRRRYAASLYHSSLPGLEEMLRRVQDWATWGEVERGTLIGLLSVRGRLLGGKPITDQWVSENLGLYGGIPELADKLIAGDIHYHRLEEKGVKPFFKLHPPRGGFKKPVRRHYTNSGELGYRGPAINGLIERML